MLTAQDLLRPGYSQQTNINRANAHGFYAETGPAGELRHFGFYRQGEPVGWTVSVENGRTYATRAVTREAGGEDGTESAEEWLREMVSTIYRDAEAEHCVCLFCHKTRAEVATLVAGPERYTYICDECITTCAKILAETRDNSIDEQTTS